ncbi:MAG: membrane dipeptidase [Anaerolineae bacterium]
MFIVDTHQDIAYNALRFGRDYRHSVAETRKREVGSSHPNGIATCGLPDSLLGRVAIVGATLFTAPDGSGGIMLADSPRYKTPAEAHQLALQQFDYYQRLADECEKIRLVRTEAELDAVLETWKPGTEFVDHRQGFVVLMENADPIVEPKQFEEWYERGVRIVGPAWVASRYCGGTGMPGALTDLGRELLEVLASFNAILDLSHMAEESFLEAVDRYEGVVIASHSNPRHFRHTDRHLSDEMILRLAERDGVMGIVPYNNFLSDDWRKGNPRTDVPFSVVLDAMDYVCQLTGSAAHVGIGTDFDGGFGVENIPAGMDTITDVWRIGDGLRARGYAEADIEAILGGNMLRKLRQSLP